MGQMEMAEPILAQVVDDQNPVSNGTSCPGCGAPLDHDDAFCTSCGLPCGAVDEAAPTQRFDRTWFECKNCGSTVATDPNQRSYICPFCDSNYVVQHDTRRDDRRQPDFIIGFVITAEVAQERFRQWIGKNAWFRPGDLNRSQLESKLVGVYLPFWSFSMLANSHWSAQIGEYWYRTETYTTKDSKGNTVTRTRQVRETEWWPLSGRHHRYYNGYLVSGSGGLTQSEADQIKPFNLPALRRYEPYFLAGWLCEEYSVQYEQAMEISKSVFEDYERRNVGAFMPGDTHRGLNVSSSFSHINTDLCLLPIYLWSYRYRDKLYRFMVNGQTGRVAGQKPLSGKRITAMVVFLLIVVAVIVLGMYLGGAFQ